MIKLNKLIPPENHDLFSKFPKLNNIWENKNLQNDAKKSYEIWNENKTGEIFTINTMNSVIGIIGWFEYGNILDTLRLRYYGIIPEYRKYGYGQVAIDLLLNRLSDIVSLNYKYLSESVSINRPSAINIVSHFKKLGFQEFNDPDYGENADCGPTISLRVKIPGR